MRDTTLPDCQRKPRGRRVYGHETLVKTRIIEKVEYVTRHNNSNQGNRKQERERKTDGNILELKPEGGSAQ